MTKNSIGVVVAVAAVAVIGGAAIIMNNKDDKPSSATSNSADSKATTHEQEDAASGAHQDSESKAPPASQTANQVEIKGFDFTQKKITVKKGTKVTWTNKDDAKHDITPDSPSPDFATSELFGKGESYSFTFNTVGTYAYHCSPHPYMKGVVEVTE